MSAARESDRIIQTKLRRSASQPFSFRDLLDRVDHPAIYLAPAIAPSGHAIGGGEMRGDLSPPVKKPQRPADGPPGPPIKTRPSGHPPGAPGIFKGDLG